MFAKIILVAFALFAVALAAPEAKPSHVHVPGVAAYTAYSAPVVGAYSAPYVGAYSAPYNGAYSAYSAVPYAAYSGVYPGVYGAYHGAVVV